jgi:long-chain fatty acid transport protein
MRGKYVILAVLLTGGLAATAKGQGIILPGAGPVNRSMAGASTAAPLDALGANYWNPAAISGLPRSEVHFAGEFLYADTHLASEAPLRGLAGNTRSNSGLSPLSGVGFVYHLEESDLSVGLYLGSLAGGGVNYPGTPGNPVLNPTSALDLIVLGPNYAGIAIFQTAANVSLQVTDRLAVGAGPVVSTTFVRFDPAFFATPDDASGDGLFTFPSGTHGRPFWGGGFRLGAYYHLTEYLDVGLAYSSTQWMETWKFNARDEVGNPRLVSIQATLPRIISLGLAYKGIEGLVLASDIRWIDYADTDLWGVAPPGGTGWQSIWSFAFGAQYQMSERTSVRIGYLYNENPVPSPRTLFNTQLPVLIQHTLSAGFSLKLTDNITASLAYVHGFRNAINGPIIQVTGSNVTLDTAYDSFLFGVRVEFGAPKKPGCCQADCCPPEGPYHPSYPRVPAEPIIGPAPVGQSDGGTPYQGTDPFARMKDEG